MTKQYLFCLVAIVLSLTVSAQTQAPAFPGAEGHGRYVTGGRTGTIVHVTNLADKGTGSFRAAVTGGSNRIVVFDVAGVIPLASEITFKDNITILGQTAPYPGITLRYYTIRPGANNIIRFIRFRRGQEKDVDDGADASWQRNKTGIIFDHCSFSWSIDEVASFYDNNNFTMQWCTIGESLVNAGHGKGAHGYGGIWGGKLASFHHNMILHVANRSPRFNGARYNWTGYTSNKLYSQYKWANAVQAENVDFRNCVIYNANGCYGGPGGGQINMVGNYYKSGPAATVNRLTTVSIGNSGNSSGHSEYWTMTSRYYLEGNQIDGSNAGWEKMSYDSDVPSSGGQRYTNDPNHYYGENLTYTKVGGTDCLPIKLDSPAPTGEITTHTAATAFEKVLSYAGASLYRDTVDARYAKEALTKTATYTGSVTKKKGLIDVVADCKGYTEADFPTGSHPAGFDSDNDGIPDAWETANGLNPNSAADARTKTLDPKGFYTNLEVYANSLVEDIMKAGNSDAQSTIDEYYPAYTLPTVVNTVNSDAAAVVEYYTLDGVRLATPQRGLNICVRRTQGGKQVTKVIR
ncbi:MAG: pectate lyase [Prevotella sp.]|nr:pectate lyase [Prevotella sp.]